MRQTRELKRFRLVPILVAGGIGYLLGGWNVTGLRSAGLSASQAVALRFPEDWEKAQAAPAAPVASSDVQNVAAVPAADGVQATQVLSPDTTGSIGMTNAQLALFSPDPMVPPPAIAQAPQAPVQLASAEDVAPVLARKAAAMEPPAAAPENHRDAKSARTVIETRPAAVPARRRAERPGYMLDDAQIASIRRRLNLTPDQERMWPAVEAALRNIAYKTAHEVHHGGASQLASADPDSAEVQDLKSAAIPLIMSFNDEQKDEVRNLAHVMGLDQLASQF